MDFQILERKLQDLREKYRNLLEEKRILENAINKNSQPNSYLISEIEKKD